MVHSLEILATNTFKAAVKAVNPYKAVKKCVTISPSQKYICCDDHSFELGNKNVYACAFGKAGYEMFRAIDEIASDHLSKSILSLPIGQKTTHKNSWKSSNVEAFFGAANNIADNDSNKAAESIFTMSKKLNENDLLISLISGGGSALLPLPCDGITIEDKQRVTKALAKKAASIQEMNTVRKALSMIKGGGLLKAAYPCKVLSLILSDIIGDPVDLIASGPTVEDYSQPQDAFNIIKKYELTKNLSVNVINHLKNRKTDNNPLPSNYVKIVASNRIALKAAAAHLQGFGYDTIILTDSLNGEARICGTELINLIDAVNKNSSDAVIEGILKYLVNDRTQHKKLTDYLLRSKRPLSLLLGGETTVTIKGTGIGGRNQELALSSSLRMNDLGISPDKCIVLACGTDGIDGPTDAAGAFGKSNGIGCKTKALESLNNNDTYNYHKKAGTLIKIGHTGTNVMDMVIALVR